MSRVGWASRPPSDASCVAAFPTAVDAPAHREDRSGGTPEPAGRMPTLPETRLSPDLRVIISEMWKSPEMFAKKRPRSFP